MVLSLRQQKEKKQRKKYIKLTTIVHRLDKRRKKQNKTKCMWRQYMGKDKGERKKKHATR
jgi:hypothetical protein